MSILSAVAIFFIIWWVVLFGVLPIGVRSQAETGSTVPGTEPGAPIAPQMGKKLLITTAIAGVLFCVFFLVTVVFGYSFDDIPSVVPDFSVE